MARYATGARFGSPRAKLEVRRAPPLIKQQPSVPIVLEGERAFSSAISPFGNKLWTGSSSARPELSTTHLGSRQLNSSASDDKPNTGGANTDADSRRNRKAPNSTQEDNSNPDQHNNLVHRIPVSESGVR